MVSRSFLTTPPASLHPEESARSSLPSPSSIESSGVLAGAEQLLDAARADHQIGRYLELDVVDPEVGKELAVEVVLLSPPPAGGIAVIDADLGKPLGDRVEVAMIASA